MFDVLNSPFSVTIIALIGSFLFLRHQIKKQRNLQQQRIKKQRELQQQTLSIQEMQRLWGDRSFHGDIADVMLIGKEADIAQYAKDRKDHLDKDSEEKKKWVEETTKIVRTINYFDLISVGIYEGIYDSDIIERILKDMVLEFYDRTEPFIKEIQKQYPQSAIDFEKFAKRLKDS